MPEHVAPDSTRSTLHVPRSEAQHEPVSRTKLKSASALSVALPSTLLLPVAGPAVVSVAPLQVGATTAADNLAQHRDVSGDRAVAVGALSIASPSTTPSAPAPAVVSGAPLGFQVTRAAVALESAGATTPTQPSRNLVPLIPACATVPAAPPAVSAPANAEWLRDELHRFLVAFGTAMEATDNRRTRDALHTILVAQQEHQALVMQALHDQRHEYTDNLGRTVDRLVERMAEELTPTSVMGLGELFRESTNELTAIARRSEKIQGRTLEVLGGLTRGLEQLAEQVAELRAQVAHVPELVAEADPPRRAATSAKGLRAVRPAPQGSPLERLPDDM